MVNKLKNTYIELEWKSFLKSGAE